MSQIINTSTSEVVASIAKITKQIYPNVIRNTLLDGSDHIQIIGTPATRLEVEVTVTAAERELIIGAYSNGTSLTFEDNEASYTGLIYDIEPWVKLTHEYYRTMLFASVEAVV